MGTCSANMFKISTEKQAIITLQPIDKKVTFDIDNTDVINTSIKADELAIGEKAFVLWRSA